MLAIVPTPLCVFERNCSTARKGASTTDNRDLVKAQQPLLFPTSRKYSPGRSLNEQALLTVLFALDTRSEQRFSGGGRGVSSGMRFFEGCL